MKNRNMILYVAFALAVIFLFQLMLWNGQEVRLIVYYAEGSEGSGSQFFFDIGEGYSETNSCYNKITHKTQFVLPQYISSVKAIRGDFSDQPGKVYIEKIEIQKNPLSKKILWAKDIVGRIDHTSNLDYEIESDCLVIKNNTDDGQIYFKDNLVDEIKEINGISVFELMLFAIDGIVIGCILIYYKNNLFHLLKGQALFCKKNLVLLLGMVFIDLMILHMGPTFNIRYHDSHIVGSASLFWESKPNNGFSEQNSTISTIKNGNARLHTLKRLPGTSQYRIDFIDASSDLVGIEGIKLYYGIIPLTHYSGEELYQYIINTINIRNIRIDNGIMYIEPQTSNPIVYFDTVFAQLVNKQIRNGCVLFCLIANCLLILIAYFPYINRKILRDYVFDLRYRDKIIVCLKILICFGLVISTGFIVWMAMGSNFNTHPDEWVTRKAIDYYLLHWIPPDIRDEAIADTFSAYGYSRLEELSIYYFLAAKLGGGVKTLLHCANYYRVFNIFLYFMICSIVIKNIWRESWLAVCSIATPQLCYIFSYATSDAWDYFCSFLLIYQVTAKNSSLNKALGNPDRKKRYAELALFSILSALVFMGKTNYYVVLLLAFIVFLFKLIEADSFVRKRLMKDYMFLLAVFVVAFMTRYSINFYYYGFDQKEISAQVSEMRAEYSYKSSTAAEDRNAGLQLKERGVSLKELCDNYNFLGISYKSFCGVYGWMEYYSENSYYIVLGIGYTMLFLLLIFNILNLCANEEVEFLVVAIIILASIIASMYHSWTGDYQPQGRYLLPDLIVMGYLISNIKNRNLETLYVLLMTGISLIVPYGFYTYGILQMV